MSLNLLNSYEQEFTDALNNMRTLLRDEQRMHVYFKANQDPKEYGQAQNFLKQMALVGDWKLFLKN